MEILAEDFHLNNLYNCEVTISLSNSGKKQKRGLHISLDTIIFSPAGLKTIYRFIFQELLFTLRCSFCNNRTKVRQDDNYVDSKECVKLYGFLANHLVILDVKNNCNRSNCFE